MQLAYIDSNARVEMEREWIRDSYEIDQVQEIPTVDDYRDAGLEVKPPDVVRYFVRTRADALARFAEKRAS